METAVLNQNGSLDQFQFGEHHQTSSNGPMTSPWKKQPEDIADAVLKRATLSKMARRLQSQLALAQFKTKHGWEDLSLDAIEPRVEEEIRRKRLVEGDIISESSSSSSASDILPYPTTSSRRTLMSSPLKAPLFSDAVGSSNGSSGGRRKRTFFPSFDSNNMPAFLPEGPPVSSSPSKRFRISPAAQRTSLGGWRDSHQLAHSSPIKPRRQEHFTTSGGPDVSFFKQRRLTNELTSPNFAAPIDDDDDQDLPAHSFSTNVLRSSPPRTPPMQTRSLTTSKRANKENQATGKQGKSGEEGADLLLYLAASPSPAVPSKDTIRARMEPPSTPPSRNSRLDLPSSMMTTPGGGNLFPQTPGQGFDFADFVNITPSPAQKNWKTPSGFGASRTPLSVARRRLTFDD